MLRRVFDSGQYEYWAYREIFNGDTNEYRVKEFEAPSTFEGFWESEKFFAIRGRHSLGPGVDEIREPGSPETDLRTQRYYGGMYSLDAAETMRYFGSVQLTWADFDRVGFNGLSKSGPASHRWMATMF